MAFCKAQANTLFNYTRIKSRNLVVLTDQSDRVIALFRYYVVTLSK